MRVSLKIKLIWFFSCCCYNLYMVLNLWKATRKKKKQCQRKSKKKRNKNCRLVRFIAKYSSLWYESLITLLLGRHVKTCQWHKSVKTKLCKNCLKATSTMWAIVRLTSQNSYNDWFCCKFKRLILLEKCFFFCKTWVMIPFRHQTDFINVRISHIEPLICSSLQSTFSVYNYDTCMNDVDQRTVSVCINFDEIQCNGKCSQKQ